MPTPTMSPDEGNLERSQPSILLLGLRSSGKSSIQQVVFSRLAPDATKTLPSTTRPISHVMNSFFKLEVIDLPGQLYLNAPETYTLNWLFDHPIPFADLDAALASPDADRLENAESFARLAVHDEEVELKQKRLLAAAADVAAEEQEEEEGYLYNACEGPSILTQGTVCAPEREPLLGKARRVMKAAAAAITGDTFFKRSDQNQLPAAGPSHPQEQASCRGTSHTRIASNKEGNSENVGAIIFVVDALADYFPPLQRLYATMLACLHHKRDMYYEVFIHKVDFLPDDRRLEIQREIHQRVLDELTFLGIAEKVKIAFHSTSIYDYSVFEAVSRVAQKLTPRMATLEILLDRLCHTSNLEKAFVLDAVSKIYFSTDSDALDPLQYELCGEVVDLMHDCANVYDTKHRTPTFYSSVKRLAMASIMSLSPNAKPSDAVTSIGSNNTTPAMAPATPLAVLDDLDGDLSLTEAEKVEVALQNEAWNPMGNLIVDQGSHVKLSDGTVVYFHPMTTRVALVGILRSPFFDEHIGMIEHNFKLTGVAVLKAMERAAQMGRHPPPDVARDVRDRSGRGA